VEVRLRRRHAYNSKTMNDHTYHYSLSEGWRQIDDPLEQLADLADKDYQEALRSAGYISALTIGVPDGVQVVWYMTDTKAPYRYLVDFSEGGFDWFIYASDFPSVVELLHKLAVICQASIVQDVYDETEATRESESNKTDEARRRARRN
jgi:hypothetical protein